MSGNYVAQTSHVVQLDFSDDKNGGLPIQILVMTNRRRSRDFEII